MSGTGEVISIMTPKKMSLPLNEDVISVNAIISDLWTKIVGIYTLTALTSQGENFEEEENILRDGVTDPTATIIILTKRLYQGVHTGSLVGTDLVSSPETTRGVEN